MTDRSAFITALRLLGKAIPSDRLRTAIYLNGIMKPRKFFRKSINTFYRMDLIYDVISEFKDNYRGDFSILEFGVADGYSFTKQLYATKYLGMEDRITVHGFDSFEGMPEAAALKDQDLVSNAGWLKGQYKGDYDSLVDYCEGRYKNYALHKGYFEQSLTDEVIAEIEKNIPILLWIDCDYYSSAKVIFDRLIPHIPTGCVVYFDEYEFNFGSRFTGEARIVDEVNRGLFGDGIELVLDTNLSWDSQRVYRFINSNMQKGYERVAPVNKVDDLRRRTNDSPLP